MAPTKPLELDPDLFPVETTEPIPVEITEAAHAQTVEPSLPNPPTPRSRRSVKLPQRLEDFVMK